MINKKFNLPKALNSKVIFKTKNLSVVETKVKFPRGIDHQYTLRFPDAVIAIVLDKKKNIYLAKEWRSGWNRVLYKLPGGKIEGKGYIAVKKSVKKEILEELGIEARKITKLVTLPDDAWVVHHFTVFLAEDIVRRKQELERFEHIEVVKMPLKKALAKFTKGSPNMTSESVLGLLLAKERLKL